MLTAEESHPSRSFQPSGALLHERWWQRGGEWNLGAGAQWIGEECPTRREQVAAASGFIDGWQAAPPGAQDGSCFFERYSLLFLEKKKKTLQFRLISVAGEETWRSLSTTVVRFTQSLICVRPIVSNSLPTPCYPHFYCFLLFLTVVPFDWTV